MRFSITDWYDLHCGFELDLKPGYTALVGPNGAGKTTLLSQLRELARGDDSIDVFDYSNLVNGQECARQLYAARDEFDKVASLMMSSEGEAVAFNFAENVSKLGTMVRRAVLQRRRLLVLLDAIDSGASIDRIRELRSLFSLIENDAGDHVFLVVAGNSYEMAKNANCLDVRTGQYLTFADYESYADYICSFKETHPPVHVRPKGRGRKKGGASHERQK